MDKEGQSFSFNETFCRRSGEGDDVLVFDRNFDRDVLNVDAGSYCFLDDGASMLAASIGSGVCVSIYDEKLHFGILAYVALPDSLLDAFPNLSSVPQSMIDAAIAPLEDAIMQMKQNGAGKNRVRLRLFGGADFSDDPERGTKTGIFVKEYLSRKGLNIMGEDLGGEYARRIYFFPDNARVERFFLRRDADRINVRQAENVI